MSQIMDTILPQLEANYPAMIAQLHQFCEINTGSTHISGLKKMHSLLQEVFQPLGDTQQTITFPSIESISLSGQTEQHPVGDALFIQKRPHLTHRVLLSGHMDTVYDAHHPFQQLTYRNDHCINGPGVADMKGGLIVLLQALTVFETLPIASHLGWDVLINADEELGSLASGSLLESMAPNYQAALVYEPALTQEGTLARKRKGNGKFTLIATGKAAHAGRDFHQGQNAICLLSEAVLAVHALNQLRDGVTINVGLIAGGSALNIVPDKAVAKLDVRITQPDDMIWVQKQLSRIASQYHITCQGNFGRPVKRVNQATEALFLKTQQVGRTLGLTLDWKDSGGCSDGNNLAKQGLAVLDSLGVRGGHIHTSEEFILLDSLVERAALSTLILTELAKQNKQNKECLT